MQNRTTLRTFYILILTQTFSLVGSEMTSLAVAIKVFKDTSQATPLALTMFFATLPSLVSASIAGVLADRWDRRYVMMLADTGQAVGTLLLLISFATCTRYRSSRRYLPTSNGPPSTRPSRCWSRTATATAPTPFKN